MNTYEKQKSKLPGVATIVSTIIPGWGWEWILSNSTTIHCLQRIHFTSKDINRLKVKGWETAFLKKAGAFIAGKTDFYTKILLKM